MIDKLWMTKEENIEKQGVFWNMMSSGINSIVSMLLLWIVTRISGIYEAGIFSLGFSTSQMMLTIGNYGMRNYQVTDVDKKYSMRTYLASRIITNLFMMFCVVGFCAAEGYYFEKMMVTILLCLLKVTDAFDDVYGGFFQRNMRLDISGKMMTIRIGIYVLSFVLCLCISKNLIMSCFVMCLTSLIVLILLVYSTKKIFPLNKPLFNGKTEWNLLIECAPLCISAFLLNYMGNASKYAIDFYLTEEAQAYYTYLFMPCFVINLFVGFALQPLLVRMSKTWAQKKYSSFLKLCMAIFAGAAGIAVVIIGAGNAIGCEILSLVFGVDLIAYTKVLNILLVGGAFFAFAVIEQIILTVMRKQVYLLIGFGLSSVTAFVISKPLVYRLELFGAGIAYMISAGVLFLTLGFMIILFYRKRECVNG